MARFELQFPAELVPGLASRFSYTDDSAVQAAQSRGDFQVLIERNRRHH